MAVVNGYCTVPELREHFADSSTNLTTALLERAINATSRAIDRFCGRRFWLDAEDALTTREYRPDDPYEADVADISTTTGLVIKTDTTGDHSWATTWTSDQYQLEPLNADVDGGAFAWWTVTAVEDELFPIHPRRTTLQVTARHGWSAVPDGVTEACILRAAAIFKRKEAVFGIAGLNGFGEVRISRRDPDVMDLLHPYVKIRVGAV